MKINNNDCNKLFTRNYIFTIPDDTAFYGYRWFIARYCSLEDAIKHCPDGYSARAY